MITRLLYRIRRRVHQQLPAPVVILGPNDPQALADRLALLAAFDPAHRPVPAIPPARTPREDQP